MRIDDIIEELKKIRKVHGNLPAYGVEPGMMCDVLVEDIKVKDIKTCKGVRVGVCLQTYVGGNTV